MSENLYHAVRSSAGTSIYRGITKPDTVMCLTGESNDRTCRVLQFSNTGQYLCYCDGLRTVLIECGTNHEIFSLDLPRTQQVTFSPKDRILTTCEPYVVYNAKTAEEDLHRQPPPNLRLFTLPDGKHVTTMTAQKQEAWKLHWTDDEVYAARIVNSEIFIHKSNSFAKYEYKWTIKNVGSCSLSPGVEPYHVAVFIRATGGQPALVQLRRLDANSTIAASKTFFKCDRVSMTWNMKGNAVIILTIVDVDQSNRSYYGEQNLHIASVNGDGFTVSLDKKGPVYCAKWTPSGKHFVVCYGYMPSRATMFSHKGDAVFDFGEGPRNEIHFNRFGNILVLCGFGNISSGRMQFWDVENRREIVSIEVPNTTALEWAPDGQHLMTATTTPRLRMDNVYRIWHYTGRMVYEQRFDLPLELFQVQWRPVASGTYHPFGVAVLSAQDKAMTGLIVQKKNSSAIHPADNLPQGAITKNAYVPPHLRKGQKGALTTSSDAKPAALSEKEKRTRTLERKLNEITKLVQRRQNGEALEANQLAKIKKEQELIDELEKLKASS